MTYTEKVSRNDGSNTAKEATKRSCSHTKPDYAGQVMTNVSESDTYVMMESQDKIS